MALRRWGIKNRRGNPRFIFYFLSGAKISSFDFSDVDTKTVGNLGWYPWHQLAGRRSDSYLPIVIWLIKEPVEHLGTEWVPRLRKFARKCSSYVRASSWLLISKALKPGIVLRGAQKFQYDFHFAKAKISELLESRMLTFSMNSIWLTESFLVTFWVCARYGAGEMYLCGILNLHT